MVRKMLETNDQEPDKKVSFTFSVVIFNQKQIQVGVMLISTTSQTVPSVLDDTPQGTGDLNSKDRREMVDVCCSSFVDNKERDSNNGYEYLARTSNGVIELLWIAGYDILSP